MNTREVVEGLYGAAARRDLEAFFGAVADDVVVQEPGFLPYGGKWSGKEELLRLFGELAATFDLTRLRAEYLVVEGDRCFAVLHVGLAGSDDEMVVAEESVVRDGKVSELRVFVFEGASLVPSIMNRAG